jgi:hypothetical protein
MTSSEDRLDNFMNTTIEGVMDVIRFPQQHVVELNGAPIHENDSTCSAQIAGWRCILSVAIGRISGGLSESDAPSGQFQLGCKCTGEADKRNR